MERTTQAMTYGGAATSVFSGITLNDVGVIVGIAVAVVGLFGNWAIQIYFKREELKLAKARHVAELAVARVGDGDGDA